MACLKKLIYFLLFQIITVSLVKSVQLPEPVKPLFRYNYPNSKGHYDFGYQVKDNDHFVNMAHQEKRGPGNTVHGTYQLVQPDGRLRVVKYYDEGAGFNAEVAYYPYYSGPIPVRVRPDSYYEKMGVPKYSPLRSYNPERKRL